MEMEPKKEQLETENSGLREQPGEIAVRVESPQDVFAKFDELDDKAIIAQLEGKIVKTAVYHFVEGSTDIWGIGKIGVDMCAEEEARRGVAIRDGDVHWAIDPTDPEYVLFTATVSRWIVGKTGAEAQLDTAIGTKRQGIKLKLKSGQIVPNKFWFEQGSQKAIRNARLRLIPQEIQAKIIQFAKEKGHILEVKPEIASNENPPDNYPRITLFKTDGAKISVTKYEAFAYFEKIKKVLGDDIYYGALGSMGYEKKSQIPLPELSRVYATLVQEYKTNKGDK